MKIFCVQAFFFHSLASQGCNRRMCWLRNEGEREKNAHQQQKRFTILCYIENQIESVLVQIAFERLLFERTHKEPTRRMELNGRRIRISYH